MTQDSENIWGWIWV